MNILSLENTCFNLNELPTEVDDNTRFAILDNSNPAEPDFFFQPLIFLESFNSPAIVLKIDGKEIAMPIEWYIAVGDSSCACDIEILPLTSLNSRGFEALVFNPLTSYRVEFKPIEIINFYNDVKWYFPKMRSGHLLATPLSVGANPDCSYFIKEITRNSEIIKLDLLL